MNKGHWESLLAVGGAFFNKISKENNNGKSP